LPGDRYYVTSSSTNAERGLAYNPATSNLLIACRAPSNNIVVKIGQQIYTPTDSNATEVIPDDRPYAGILFAGLSLHQRYRTEDNLEILDAREITVGIIGPWSFAKEFQDGVHDILGDSRFHGWAHQIKNEPAFQVAFDKKFKEYRGKEPVLHDFSGDFIRSIGVRLGNIETSANVGIEGRVGWNIPNDFGSFTIRPGTDSSPPEIEPVHVESTSSPAVNNSPRLGVHFFGIIDLKMVGWNFSVDGNMFESSHRVTREPLVAFSAGGVSFPTIIRKRAYNLAVMQVYQTSDFKERHNHHAYRSIALSVEF
ncbi:MAG: lipid A deacylase LpxR family protein, partial [Pseudobdellovibrio sp.]